MRKCQSILVLCTQLLFILPRINAFFAHRQSCNKPPSVQRGCSLQASTVDTAGLVLEKVLDTCEDVALHARRNLFRPAVTNGGRAGLASWSEEWSCPADSRPRVLVLGSGWAAHAFIKVIDTERFRVLVVSPRAFFVFTPMLAASAVGSVEYRSITEPVRASNPLVSFLEGNALRVDPFSARFWLSRRPL